MFSLFHANGSFSDVIFGNAPPPSPSIPSKNLAGKTGGRAGKTGGRAGKTGGRAGKTAGYDGRTASFQGRTASRGSKGKVTDGKTVE